MPGYSAEKQLFVEKKVEKVKIEFKYQSKFYNHSDNDLSQTFF